MKIELMFYCAADCGWREFASDPDEIVELTMAIAGVCGHCGGCVDVYETSGVVVIDEEDVRLCEYCEERDATQLVWYTDGKVLMNCGYCLPAGDFSIVPLDVVLVESES